MTLNPKTLRDERGIAMVYVVLVMMVMSSIAFVTLESIQHEQTTSYSQTNKQTAYQAAEAGIDDYLAKMKDDPQYYGHSSTCRRVHTPRPAHLDDTSRRRQAAPPRRSRPLLPGPTPPSLQLRPGGAPQVPRSGATRTARIAGARRRTATSTTSRSRRRRRATPRSRSWRPGGRPAPRTRRTTG